MIVVHRAVEWQDTDAAGHYHHATVIRWVEAAEAELYARLGLDLMGIVPRVRYEVDYTDRLFYGEAVSVALWVESLGETSVTFAFEVRGPRGIAARGRMVVVYVSRADGRPTPWPPNHRSALVSADRGKLSSP